MRLFIMITDVIGIWFGISVICAVIGMHMDNKTFESFGEEVRWLIQKRCKNMSHDECKLIFKIASITVISIFGFSFITDAIKHKKAAKRAKELQEWADKELAELKDRGLIE